MTRVHPWTMNVCLDERFVDDDGVNILLLSVRTTLEPAGTRNDTDASEA